MFSDSEEEEDDVKSIVAFRAVGVQGYQNNGRVDVDLEKGKDLLITIENDKQIFTLVTWNKIEYMVDTYGSSKSFNGTVFTTPVSGLYSFYVTVRHDSKHYGHVYLNGHRQNDSCITIAHGVRALDTDRPDNITVQATTFLTKNDLIYVQLEGTLSYLTDCSTTYFEGRLISKIDSSMI